MASWEWPSRSETTFRSTPADRSRLALVWRRSWSGITGSPASWASAWKCRVAYSGRSALPSSRVNISPESFHAGPHAVRSSVLGLLLSAEHPHGLGVDIDNAFPALGLGRADHASPIDVSDLLVDGQGSVQG